LILRDSTEQIEFVTCISAQTTYIPTMAIDLIPNAPTVNRVVVAMSGGVDSSTTAALMVEAGYEVIGVTLKLYDSGGGIERKGACCAGKDIVDARRVAEKLKIPHYVLDYESRFRDEVIDDFAESYLRGETPIPCVRCNQTVKFRDLLATAKDLDAEALVTGHYVRRVEGLAGPELHRGADLTKDQSYFLFATTRPQLSYLWFPLGSMEKAETRYHAERFQLPVSDKPDSQDICFVSNGDYAQLLGKLRPNSWEPGDIVDVNGKRLGGHRGIVHFTIGQRRGLGVAVGEPLYVIHIDPPSRQVVVGPKEYLKWQSCVITDVNWLVEPRKLSENYDVQVKIRSSAPLLTARLAVMDEKRWRVTFSEPTSATSPGQAVVIYKAERMLGGGWITRDET